MDRIHFEWDDVMPMKDSESRSQPSDFGPTVEIPEKLLTRWMDILNKDEYYEQSGVVVAAEIKGFLANPKGFDPNTV